MALSLAVIDFFIYLAGWAGLGMEIPTLSKEDQEPWLRKSSHTECFLLPAILSVGQASLHLIDVFTQSSQSCSLVALVYLSAANCDEHLHLLWLVVPSSNLSIRHPLLMGVANISAQRSLP